MKDDLSQTYNVHAADATAGEIRQRLTGPHGTLFDAYRALPGKRYPEGVSVIRSDGRTGLFARWRSSARAWACLAFKDAFFCGARGD